MSLTGCAAGRVATCCADEFKHAAQSQSFRRHSLVHATSKAAYKMSIIPNIMNKVPGFQRAAKQQNQLQTSERFKLYVKPFNGFILLVTRSVSGVYGRVTMAQWRRILKVRGAALLHCKRSGRGAGARGVERRRRRGHSGWTGGESSSGSGGLLFALFRNRSTTGYAILFILSTAALQRCSMLRHTRCVALR